MNNVREKSKRFEESFWSKHQIEEKFDDRIYEISDLLWEKILKLEKELKLKENVILTTKTDEEIVEMLFNKVKKQADPSFGYPDTDIYWSEIGVDAEEIFEYPQSIYYRIEQINKMVWQKVKILIKQRKHEEIERERNEIFKFIPEIIEWVKEKRLKKLLIEKAINSVVSHCLY